MPAISPTHAHAFWLLRNEIYTRIDDAEFLALNPDPWPETDQDTARKVILDLVETVRSVVSQHSSDTFGRCRFCTGTWPCRSVQAIHQVVNDPSRELATLATS